MRLYLALVIFFFGVRWVHVAAPASVEPARLRISIPGIGTTSYPLIMAQKKGCFRAEGIDVELIPMSGGLAVKTLMTGEVNLTAAGTPVATPQGAQRAASSAPLRPRRFFTSARCRG